MIIVFFFLLFLFLAELYFTKSHSVIILLLFGFSTKRQGKNEKSQKIFEDFSTNPVINPNILLLIDYLLRIIHQPRLIIVVIKSSVFKFFTFQYSVYTHDLLIVHFLCVKYVVN